MELMIESMMMAERRLTSPMRTPKFSSNNLAILCLCIIIAFYRLFVFGNRISIVVIVFDNQNLVHAKIYSSSFKTYQALYVPKPRKHTSVSLDPALCEMKHGMYLILDLVILKALLHAKDYGKQRTLSGYCGVGKVAFQPVPQFILLYLIIIYLHFTSLHIVKNLLYPSFIDIILRECTPCVSPRTDALFGCKHLSSLYHQCNLSITPGKIILPFACQLGRPGSTALHDHSRLYPCPNNIFIPLASSRLHCHCPLTRNRSPR